MPVTHKLPPMPGCALLLLLVLSACAAPLAPAPPPDPLATAAAQATAIIQQAQASALLQKAEAQATALLKKSDTQTPPAASTTYPSSTLPPVQLEASAVPVEDIPVEITRVSFAGEGAYIYVEYKAAPKIARTWMQGKVSVLDEGSGIIYSAIPVAPVIGPLIARPKIAGQIGYVMLVNAPTPLPAGAQVTVTLGDYQKEHITVQ